MAFTWILFTNTLKSNRLSNVRREPRCEIDTFYCSGSFQCARIQCCYVFRFSCARHINHFLSDKFRSGPPSLFRFCIETSANGFVTHNKVHCVFSIDDDLRVCVSSIPVPIQCCVVVINKTCVLVS